LRNGKYHNGTVVNGVYVDGDFSGKKPIIYIMMVIEYQFRGLPHAHIVYRIGTAPEPRRHNETPEQRDERHAETIKFIDGFEEIREDGVVVTHLPHVSASRPGKVDKPQAERSADEEAQCIHDDLVGKFQLSLFFTFENNIYIMSEYANKNLQLFIFR
jgi:hypothetical protein